MQIAAKKVVAVTYLLRENDANGAYIEEANEQEPLTFIYGIGQMLEAFEANLTTKSVGDDFAFGIPFEEAYGPSFEEAIVDMPRSTFEGYEDMLQMGAFVPMNDGEGNQLNGQIVNMTDDNITVNFNHPMAGVNLHFTGKIVSIRDAEEHELDHGHVHGEGGVHH